MTQTIFSNKFCPALRLFAFTLQKNLGFTAIATVLTLILSPFYLMMQIGNMESLYVTELLNFNEIFIAPAFLIAIGVCAFFVVLLYINFAFLYSKVSADAFNSMPISRTGLMLSRFFACVVSALVPLVAGYIGFFITANMDNVVANMGYIWQGFGYSALMLLFCGTFMFIFVIAGGTVFDSLVSLASVSIGIPIIALLVFSMCEENLYGCVSVDYNYVRYISPFAFAILRFSDFAANPQNQTLLDLPTVITVIILTALFLGICWLLFKFRKAEAAGTAFAWKFAPFIIGLVVSIVCYFFMGAVFADDRLDIGFWLAGGVGILLGAGLYNVITNRGFKKIKESLAVIIAAVIGVVGMNLMVGFDTFGFESYVPKESQIESIDVSYRGMDMEIKNHKLITGLHQKIVNDRPNTEFDAEYINIRYTLKNGKSVERVYFLPYEFAKAYKTAIVNHEMSGQLEREFAAFSGDSYRLSHRLEDGTRYVIDLERWEAKALVDAYVKDLTQVQHTQLFEGGYKEYETLELVCNNTNPEYENEYSPENYFHFVFRNCKFYDNFKEELSKIDFVERNLFKAEEKY